MKKVIIILIVMFLASPVCAETYLLLDKNTKAVISISPEDDAQVGVGQEKLIIDDEFLKITLTAPPQDYFYKNGNFIKDYDKISKRESDKIKAKKKDIEIKAIKKRALKDAYEALKAENYNFKEVQDSDYE